MDEKIFRKENKRVDENLRDFCIFDFNFFWEITNSPELMENRPKEKFNFSRVGDSIHIFS